MIDFSKPIETRDGRKVRILATDVKCKFYPVVAVLMDDDGDESVDSYTADGKYSVEGCGCEGDDLVNVPEKHTLWLTIFYDGSASGYTTEQQAREWPLGDVLKIIPVEYTV